MSQQTKPKKKVKNKRKVKRKVRVSTKAKVRKKSEQPKGNGVKPTRTIKNDNGAVFKIKLRKKK